MNRRTVLKAAGTTAVAGAGLIGASGTAMAGGCGSFLSAPSDFPYVKDGETHGDLTSSPDELVVYIHGWNTGSVTAAQNQGYTVDDALNANDYTHPVVAYRWPSDVGWSEGKDNANEYGKKLGAWLQDYQDQNPGTDIRLIAHSLGARVALVALEELSAADREVTSVALLGGAVANGSVAVNNRWGEPIETATGQLGNYYSEDDQILDDLFKLSEWDAAVGETGFDDGGWFSSNTKPENYTDVDKTGEVTQHCDHLRRDVGSIADVVSSW